MLKISVYSIEFFIKKEINIIDINIIFLHTSYKFNLYKKLYISI